MSQPNVTYPQNKTSMSEHSQNNITRNEKILQGEKTGVLLFIISVHIIMYV